MILEEEMPFFLEHNDFIIKKKLYLKEEPVFNNFTNYSPAYLRTTENINGYYDLMNFKEKQVLTVVASSDHIFEAILRGAKKIDGFDISIYAIMFYYLKEAAFKALEYDEYISFFYYTSGSFNKYVYEKIKPYLNKKGLEFWNLVFKMKKPSDLILSRFMTEQVYLYDNIVLTKEMLSKASSYLDKNNFYNVKNRLKEVDINIHLKDCKELDDIDGIYDYIIFSNILDYQVNYDYFMFMNAINRYLNKLSLMGEIKVAYLYRNPTKSELKNFQVSIIKHFLEATTGKPYSQKNYILTKKKN